MSDGNIPCAPTLRQPIRHRVVTGDGVHLATYRWGRADGPVLLLVHGYPDNHAIWLPLVDALADDFQIIAYDVRGFGASQKPRRLRAYRLERLAKDLEAVIRATSPERPVHLVGHDWGSIQCWEAVTEPRLQPLLASYTSVSGPCLDHVGHWMRERLAEKRAGAWRQVGGQWLSSWYIGFFHLPLLPGDKEPLVELNEILHELYGRARYDLSLNYQQPPYPSLPEEDQAWAQELIAAWTPDH